MPEIKTSPESSQVELLPAVDEDYRPDGNLKEYDIVLAGAKSIGEAALGLNKEEQEVSVDWLYIKESERGKGYSKLAFNALISHILNEYKWVDTISTSTDSLPMMKTNRSTPVPEGWHRTYLLNFRKPEDELESELFTPAGETEDPEEALNCVELGGSVTMELTKNQHAAG